MFCDLLGLALASLSYILLKKYKKYKKRRPKGHKRAKKAQKQGCRMIFSSGTIRHLTFRHFFESIERTSSTVSACLDRAAVRRDSLSSLNSGHGASR
jgi:hypothetical protein